MLLVFRVFLTLLLTLGLKPLMADCAHALSGIPNVDYFQRRAWLAAEDPVEQEQVYAYLLRLGRVNSGPLHPFETRRWEEFGRDINRLLQFGEPRWPMLDQETIEATILDVIFDSILEGWSEVEASMIVDQKLAWVRKRVEERLDELNRSDHDLKSLEIDAIRGRPEGNAQAAEAAVRDMMSWGFRELPLTDVERAVTQHFFMNGLGLEETARKLELEPAVVNHILKSFLERLRAFAPRAILNAAEDAYRRNTK